MTTMTIPVTAERASPNHAAGVSHIAPFLLAIVFLMAAAVASVLISGPMH